jgi:hypothetical protein
VTTNSRVVRIALSIAAIAALVLVPTAIAGKGGGGAKPPGGGGGGGGGGSTSTLSLALLNSTDGQAHWGQQVTFNVSTTATDRPFVALNCYPGGQWLYSATAGFFPSYPWSRNFTLSNGMWTSGAADCKATLYMTKDGTRSTTLATLDFHVYP